MASPQNIGMRHPDDQHVYPTDQAHLHTLTGRSCSCSPDLKAPCDDCDGNGCWKCDLDAMVEVTADHDGPVLVSHNRIVILVTSR